MAESTARWVLTLLAARNLARDCPEAFPDVAERDPSAFGAGISEVGSPVGAVWASCAVLPAVDQLKLIGDPVDRDGFLCPLRGW